MARNPYISNKKMYEAIVEYKNKLYKAKEENTELPRIPNYLGECIQLIANRLSTKGNFSGYPFKDEMISDGIENALRYFDRFDEKKYFNPFAYFTQCIKQSFIMRIKYEKKILYTKYKYYENIMNSVDTDLLTGAHSPFSPNIDINENMEAFIVSFEESLAKSKPDAKIKEQKGVEKFFEDDMNNE